MIILKTTYHSKALTKEEYPGADWEFMISRGFTAFRITKKIIMWSQVKPVYKQGELFQNTQDQIACDRTKPGI
jgi:hypothetical protein